MPAIPGALVGGTILFTPDALPAQTEYLRISTTGKLDSFQVTAAGEALLDDVDAAGQRTTLGLGSAALNDTGDFLTPGDVGSAAYQDSSAFLAPSDIASGIITARNDDLDFSGGSTGDVLTVQADGSLSLQAPAGISSPLVLTPSSTTEVTFTSQKIASQTANPYQYLDTDGSTLLWGITASGQIKTASSIDLLTNNAFHCELTMSAGAFTARVGGSNVLQASTGQLNLSSSTVGFVYGTTTALYVKADSLKITTSGYGDADAVQFDNDGTSGNTRLQVWDVDAASLRRVKVSPDTDSNGDPFLVLG